MDERTIYFCEVNGERRAYDPFRLDRLLAQGLDGDNLAEVIRQARSPARELAQPALEKLISAVCLAFGVTPVQADGSGCTERTLFRLLNEWLGFKAAVKKNTAPSATCAPATATSSAAS